MPTAGDLVEARQTDIGFHLLDRIYGTCINLHADDLAAALHVMENASVSVRGPLETCLGCRITFAVPAAIAAARAGELALAKKHEAQCAYLANVVMRLPAWYASHDEVRGHIAAARGNGAGACTGTNNVEALARFAAAAARSREAGHPIDAERCDGWAWRANERVVIDPKGPCAKRAANGWNSIPAASQPAVPDDRWHYYADGQVAPGITAAAPACYARRVARNASGMRVSTRILFAARSHGLCATHRRFNGS